MHYDDGLVDMYVVVVIGGLRISYLFLFYRIGLRGGDGSSRHTRDYGGELTLP